MKNEKFNQDDISFKKIFASFKHWPKIVKLVYGVDKKYLVICTVLSLVMGVVPAINLMITQKLINAVIIAGGGGLRGEVLRAFVQLLMVGVFSNVINISKKYCQENFKKILTYKLNIKIMDKSSKLRLRDFDDSDTYDKLQRAQKEAGYRPFEMFMAILTIVSGIVTLISSAMILVVWKWWAAVILIFIPILSTVSLLKQGQREFLVQWKRAPESRKAWYITYLLTRDTTFKEIKLFGLGEHLIDKYTGIFNRFLKVDKGLIKKRSILTFIFDMVNQVIVGIVTGTIIFSTVAGEIMVGNLVGYMKAVGLTQANSMLILNTLFRMYQNNLYITQLFEFLELKEGFDQCSDDSLKEISEIERIEFKSVSFKYKSGDGKYALENVNFIIEKGMSVAIVGENGSGKTTMVKLLTGLYDIEEGDILINGISIKKINKASLRRKIGITLQDFIKYELTVRENIGFGNLSFLENDEKLMKSARCAGVDGVIKGLPKEIDNQLGVWFEDGIQLSGGQWQKIAIARAFLREADAYVLDEPSASLDPIAEREIFEKFYDLTEGKIGIFISHRFSTVKRASKILVFRGGQLIERGSHEELMKFEGRYAELYNIQAEPYKVG